LKCLFFQPEFSPTRSKGCCFIFSLITLLFKFFHFFYEFCFSFRCVRW
jgi:hypothetical protein